MEVINHNGKLALRDEAPHWDEPRVTVTLYLSKQDAADYAHLIGETAEWDSTRRAYRVWNKATYTFNWFDLTGWATEREVQDVPKPRTRQATANRAGYDFTWCIGRWVKEVRYQ
jgi:hypothetical protein